MRTPNGCSGCLCSSDGEILEAVCSRVISREKMRRRVLENFTWDQVAKTIGEIG